MESALNEKNKSMRMDLERLKSQKTSMQLSLNALERNAQNIQTELHAQRSTVSGCLEKQADLYIIARREFRSKCMPAAAAAVTSGESS